MFYQSIAQVYDQIFPKNIKQLEFIDSISQIKPDDKILDIGCATGNLTELLSTKSNNVTGIDLDEELLSIARNKSCFIEYKHMNMMDLANNYDKESVDKIISFGNTLVHLPDRESVKEFFSSVYDALKNNGTFIIQIINYDRVINQNISHLATIENDHIRFIRDYVYNPAGGYVEFKTELTMKSNNKVIHNNIPLLALTMNELTEILNSVGFRNITFYGDLDQNEVNESSVSLLFSSTK